MFPGEFLNTHVHEYQIDIYRFLLARPREGESPSAHVVRALMLADPRVQMRGFREAVLNAIFEDGVNEHFLDEIRAEKLISRAKRRFGSKRTRRLLIDRCDILTTWKYRDANFVPDAYLIDPENKTVVCYEVEDSHHLNLYSIRERAAAWWNLEYIYWDFHLIAYDIVGNSRIFRFPVTDSIAQLLQDLKKSQKAHPPHYC